MSSINSHSTLSEISEYIRSNFNNPSLILKPSMGGVGVFANVDIPRGTVFHELMLTKNNYEDGVDNYSWYGRGVIIGGLGFLCNGSCPRFSNYDEGCKIGPYLNVKYNLISDNFDETGLDFITIEDIKKGDELILNYSNEYFFKFDVVGDEVKFNWKLLRYPDGSCKPFTVTPSYINQDLNKITKIGSTAMNKNFSVKPDMDVTNFGSKDTGDYLVYCISSGKLNPNTGKCGLKYNVYDNNKDGTLSLYWILDPNRKDPYVLMAATGSLDELKGSTFTLKDNDSQRTIGVMASTYKIYDECPCTYEGVLELAKKYGQTTRASFGHGPLMIKGTFTGSMYSVKFIAPNKDKEKNIKKSEGTTPDKVQKKCDELRKLGFDVTLPSPGVRGYQITTPKTYSTGYPGRTSKYVSSGDINSSSDKIYSYASVIENVVFLDENQAKIYLNYLLSAKPKFNKVASGERYVGSIYGSDIDGRNWETVYDSRRVEGPKCYRDDRISKKILDIIPSKTMIAFSSRSNVVTQPSLSSNVMVELDNLLKSPYKYSTGLNWFIDETGIGNDVHCDFGQNGSILYIILANNSGSSKNILVGAIEGSSLTPKFLHKYLCPKYDYDKYGEQPEDIYSDCNNLIAIWNKMSSLIRAKDQKAKTGYKVSGSNFSEVMNKNFNSIMSKLVNKDFLEQHIIK